MQVCWRIDNINYMLMQVRPNELRMVRKKCRDLLGIPYMYCVLDDGDVEWFPDSMQGMPVVRTDADNPPPLRTHYL